MPDAVRRYDGLLAAMDGRFRALRERHPGAIACGGGCADCCHGLFDVSLPDARRLAQAYAALPRAAQAAVARRAARLQDAIREGLPGLAPPYFIEPCRDGEVDALVEALTGARCPFLGDGGGSRDLCLVYADRPLACRLEGLPMVDSDGGLFDDWCERNFADALPPEVMRELRLDYCAMQEVEQEAALQLLARLRAAGGGRGDAPTVLIPSVVAAFEGFWLPALARLADPGAP
ncbi:MAG: YkgJ family cysteine cluster protein [Acidobacteriota bacterium]|jgi:Fe-S-cluster containining protein|nr:YkgJ family cysteine cluster protein [Acidobacteriota bacterium]